MTCPLEALAIMVQKRTWKILANRELEAEKNSVNKSTHTSQYKKETVYRKIKHKNP